MTKRQGSASSGVDKMFLHLLLPLSMLVVGVHGSTPFETSSLVAPLDQVSPSFEAAPEGESIDDFTRRLAGGALARNKALGESDEETFQRVYDHRVAVNEFYGDFDTEVYGKDTQSIMRYKHQDGEARNLCVYSNENHIFDYPMYNYQIAPPPDSFVEVRHTTNRYSINKPPPAPAPRFGIWRRGLEESEGEDQGDGESEQPLPAPEPAPAPAPPLKSESDGEVDLEHKNHTTVSRELWGNPPRVRIPLPSIPRIPVPVPQQPPPPRDSDLNCMRPRTSDGFFSVGDVMFKNGVNENQNQKRSLLVKGHGNILKPPDRFEHVITEGNPKAPSIWKPIPPPGFVCLGYVCSEGRNKVPDRNDIRCVRRDFVEQTRQGFKYTAVGGAA